MNISAVLGEFSTSSTEAGSSAEPDSSVLGKLNLRQENITLELFAVLCC